MLCEYFRAAILKNIVIFETSISDLPKLNFETKNFGTRSTFSKGPGSAFFEGPGLLSVILMTGLKKFEN